MPLQGKINHTGAKKESDPTRQHGFMLTKNHPKMTISRKSI
jgi:hypothetical protein